MKKAAALFAMLVAMSVRADEAQDVANLARRAALDDRVALYDLGTYYYSGRGVKQDYKKAAALWTKAAEKGSIGARNNLGYLYFEGLGVKRDAARAVVLWKEAAERGHGEAQLHLGNAIFRGVGIAKDEPLGLAWVICAVQSAKNQAIHPETGGGPEILAFAEKEVASMSSAVTGRSFANAKLLAEGLIDMYGRPNWPPTR